MRRLWLAVQVLLVGVVLVFVTASIVENWIEVRAAGRAVHLDWRLLAASAGLILLTYAMLIAAWRAVLRGWNERMAYGTAARIWTLSNLARYVPGRIWQIAGMAAMAQKAGVAPWAAAGSAIIVQLLAVATGTLVTVLFAVKTEYPLLIALAGLASVAAVAMLTMQRSTSLATSLLFRLTGRTIELRPVGKGPLALSAIITALAWIAYGIVLHLFTAGVLGVDLGIGTSIGAFTASYLLGLIAVFTPGGLGVREGALYLLLTGPIGHGGALVVSFGSRILMTVTELLAALIALPLTRRKAP